MKQAIVTSLIAVVTSLPFIYNPSEGKVYSENNYETVRACTTEDLQERLPNYQRLILLEKKSDSIHKEIKKLRINETVERPSKKPIR